MTVRATAMQTCDRCLKPFNEKHLKAGDEVPTFKQKGLVVTETSGTNKDPDPKFTVLFSFDDMCSDCQKAVENLLAKLRLDGSASKKTKGPAKKRGSKKAVADAPKTPEYSENPEDDPAKADTEGESVKETVEPQATATQGESSENSEPEEPELASETEETSDGDNGVGESSKGDDNLVEDPSTGDKYDPTTGEVVVKGNKSGDAKNDLPF